MISLLQSIGLAILFILAITTLFITGAICIYVIANVILGMKD